MTLYAVRYEYAEGSAVERDRHRPAHVAFLRGLFEADTLVLSGRLEHDDRPGALIVVRADDPAAVERSLDHDPFWSAGVIRERDIRTWNVAFAKAALE
ncbi:hypothetical protein SAMN05421505_111125 [Sinosporangium album]|uniref:YCII-related domain-containing protein n=1 Tax=Sinosporangium album TaxID=504805 RepID=A0A1G7ZMP5_9ACTN|nr:YciI family protein [Sinosporangium album]SDH10032.1 hypothetical protein SAMN05421505_111125 [Sinosporangium album]